MLTLYIKIYIFDFYLFQLIEYINFTQVQKNRSSHITPITESQILSHIVHYSPVITSFIFTIYNIYVYFIHASIQVLASSSDQYVQQKQNKRAIICSTLFYQLPLMYMYIDPYS